MYCEMEMTMHRTGSCSDLGTHFLHGLSHAAAHSSGVKHVITNIYSHGSDCENKSSDHF